MSEPENCHLNDAFQMPVSWGEHHGECVFDLNSQVVGPSVEFLLDSLTPKTCSYKYKNLYVGGGIAK